MELLTGITFNFCQLYIQKKQLSVADLKAKIEKIVNELNIPVQV